MKIKPNYKEKVLAKWTAEVQLEKEGYVIYGILKNARIKLGVGKDEQGAWQSACKWL